MERKVIEEWVILPSHHHLAIIGDLSFKREHDGTGSLGTSTQSLRLHYTLTLAKEFKLLALAKEVAETCIQAASHTESTECLSRRRGHQTVFQLLVLQENLQPVTVLWTLSSEDDPVPDSS